MPDKSIVLFFWRHIKPYKWFYLIMLLAPVISSFYPFAYNYAIKMLLDTMSTQENLTYSAVLFLIILFLVTQLVLDASWRISNIAEWKAEPHVRRSILTQSYDYVQHHGYTFFQDSFSGALSSKLKGILDGYDKFWDEIHHGLLAKVLKIAGKSSLINLLLRYFNPTQGNIFIDGHDIHAVIQDSLRENIAVIPQDTSLFHRTIMENIRYGKPNASDADVIEASKKAHLHDFIVTLPQHYETYVGERGLKLSGGQRQRVAIARAILKNAPILILDEATSALDSQTGQLIQDSLNYLIEDTGKTVIAIAHRLSTLKHMDRVIVIDKGQILEEGTHNTLIDDPQSLYKKLWALQEI